MKGYTMSMQDTQRRNFLKTLLAGSAFTALNWAAFPTGAGAATEPNEYDAIIIGSGLGGLSCGAAFARQGFKVLVVEQHNRPGGYATSFKRPGGFEFDVSLHSTTVGDRDGLHNLIPGFPEITDVEYIAHPDLYRVIYPDYDITVAQKNPDAYIAQLKTLFPAEAKGIDGIFEDMRGLSSDIAKYSDPNNKISMMEVPVKLPYLFKCFSKTWGQMVDTRISDPKLKAIISSQWGYYGLPPSKLSSFYYALPAIGYLEGGGYYPRGRSQTISNALVKFIEDHNGQVMLKTKAEKILVNEGAAYGVATDKGEFHAKVVVSNANAPDTINKMLDDGGYLTAYKSKMEGYEVSLSSFQIFLGLNKDIVGASGITSSEIFVETGYDMEAGYQEALAGNVENGGYGLTLYDNVFPGYSPKGKNTLNIMTLQGYDHWEPYAADYFKGEKEAYRAEKQRMADIMIANVEKTLLPGLADAIEVIEIGTPLTNLRYTGNPKGAIYGWDQTMNNSGNRRVGHSTPVRNLYLSGAWSKPGHGYSAVLGSGLECFGEIMSNWKS